MDKDTLIAALDFSRARLIGSLDAIEKSGQDTAKVLAWRPGPGRAHIAWQAMHCAATHDKYLHVNILGGQSADPQMVTAYGGGSTPSDQNVPALAAIRAALETHFKPMRAYVASLSPAELEKKVGPPDRQRTIGEMILVQVWHEAHHQGQIHLTWNLYKQAHGVK